MTTATAVDKGATVKKSGKRAKALKRFVRNPWAMIGLVLLLVTVVAAAFAPVLAPHDPDQGNLRARVAAPSWLDDTGKSDHLLGTDPLGRDLLSRIVYGARISLMIGITAVLISMVIGVTLGLIAGYYGKRVDDVIMRIADIQMAFPFILFAIIVMAVFGSGLWKLIIVLGISQWAAFARLVRGQVISVKEMDFIQSARAIGASDPRIICKHILPNVMSSIIILATLKVATNILSEASLTFIGLGVSPTIPAWGSMLADGKNYLETAWWVATFPGIAIMVTVLGFNLLGDWLRDELDPKLRV